MTTPIERKFAPLIPVLPRSTGPIASPEPASALAEVEDVATAVVEDVGSVSSPVVPPLSDALPVAAKPAPAAERRAKKPRVAAAKPARVPRPALELGRKPGKLHRASYKASSLFNIAAIAAVLAALVGVAESDGVRVRAAMPTVVDAVTPAATKQATVSLPAAAVQQVQQAALPAPSLAASAVNPAPIPAVPPPDSVAPPILAASPLPAAATAATETIAAPTPLAMEAKHLAQFDQLITPVRDAPFSLEDATRLRDAFAKNVTPPQMRALRDQMKDPAARKLIDWALARAGNASAREIKSFADANPDWPSRDLLTQRAEEQMFVAGGSVGDIKAFFDKSQPKTGIGLAALASAYVAEGDETKAAALAAAAWRRSDIPANLETGFLERFNRLLTVADHKARFDTYMIDNTRWMPERTERANVARRVLSHLNDFERRKAEARLAAYLRQPTADALLAALPSDAMTSPKADWGLAFQVAQAHRRAGRLDALVKILRDVPTTAADAGNLDEWWEERRVAAYAALKAGQPKVAYDLVKAPGPLSVNPRKDQTFLAGFIALRHLKDASLAEPQFTAFEAAADGPLSRAKATYWLARTYEAQGAAEKMRAPLERAARNTDTFYGQLARLELDPKQSEIKITPPRTPTPQEAQHFNANELVRATVLSRKANLDRWVTRALMNRLSQTLDNEAEQGLLAHLSEALGDTQMAVHIGKAAVARGHNLLLYSYPIHAMPAYSALRPPIEPALMLGITRQETEFDDSIVSGAGARGLMQVMTVTAQQVCTDHRIKCELDRLSRDPAYNVMMASAYIADRLDEFRGSYVLTIPGYNAGPGRVRQWIKEFGDPRTDAIDPIDWIHRIPFEETREYVQKVLSNTQIYRARLGDEKNALRLLSDLRRTGPGPQRRAAATPVGAPPAVVNN